MSTWNSPPQIPPFENPPFSSQEQSLQNTISYLKQLANIVSALKNDLEFLINGNLDVKNIRASSITADRLKVEELSAISANLGEITAGIIRGIEIYGSLIATNETGYPRTEMSTTDNYFKVWLNETTYIEIIDLGEEGLPQINFFRNGQQVKIGHGIHSMPWGEFPGILANTQFTIAAVPNIMLMGRVEFNDWLHIINLDSGKTLQQELDSIWSTMASLQNQIDNKADKEI